MPSAGQLLSEHAYGAMHRDRLSRPAGNRQTPSVYAVATLVNGSVRRSRVVVCWSETLPQCLSANIEFPASQFESLIIPVERAPYRVQGERPDSEATNSRCPRAVDDM
jgi:hypothetical protein